MTTSAADAEWGFDESHREFLAQFKREHGRLPRVLKIGNIANNAFKNAHILRKQGIECDVMCHDYYHVMGCPEWEQADFSTAGMNFDAPAWSKMDLGDYARPRWFAQGRMLTCIDYLNARNRGDTVRAEALWDCLVREQDAGGAAVEGSSQATLADIRGARATARRLASLYAITFPERIAQPTVGMIESQYFSILIERDRFCRLFDHYDFVVGYATDGLLPLMFSKTPYACFEHGTIRTFPFEETLFGQMCALTYACANDVLISNCDNIVAAKRLRLLSYRFLPHAMLEDHRADPSAAALREDLLRDHAADFIVFHPSRQHWSTSEDVNWEKGNDRLIRGFARFVKNERPGALLVMVAWGQTVAASRALVESLGIVDRVIWLEPQPMPVVGRYVAAADVLADQFVIGAWGAIMPHGMMLGTPTMLYLIETVHEWCFPHMPPVLNAHTADDVHASLIRAADPVYRAAIARDGPAWYDRYHGESVVAGRLTDSLRRSVAPEDSALVLRELRELRAETRQLLAAAGPRAGIGSVLDSIREVGFLGTVSHAAHRLRAVVAALRERYPLLGNLLYHLLRGPFHLMRRTIRLLLRLRAGRRQA